ncbi:hypothetical protein LTR09_004469 [Extremus antarcticus]|uniref:Heterokaryon incompatibility domain-containing protein n=1 Tax=Extremus antarcticus TaxID=702011 RepID=A0AAJ0DQ85_9PEZI|nr:hypothetical protein LTR09_004469 [Extremus antarcticus]
MSSFRLFNIATLRLERHDLFNHPPYVAASHVWSEGVFELSRGFQGCFGGRGLNAVIAQLHPAIQYCWFDTLCIDQGDPQDKLTQIPLMDRIFGQAEAVVIYINSNLDATQAEVDTLATQLEGALAMCEADAWQEEGAYWQQGECRKWIIQGMQGLLRLASTDWARRVWTLQEYILAKSVYWIGLDLVPLKIEDFMLSALPDICNTLSIDECLGPEMLVLYAFFQGMANVRLRKIDRSRVMELLGNRTATMPVDEVYGIMAASEVIIDAVAGEDQYEAWRRWCEAAVLQGNLRWILSPSNDERVGVGEVRNCNMPNFAQRHKLSASSSLEHVEPLGPIAIVDGCVTACARRIGTAKVLRRLGKVHEARSGRLHRDITIIVFAQGNWRLALQLVSAFGGGRYSLQQARAIAHVLVRSYAMATEAVQNRTQEAFQPVFGSIMEYRVWTDFIDLQQSQMIPLNEGTGCLCHILVKSASEPLITVLVSGIELCFDDLLVLDFGARAPDGRSVLMVVAENEETPGNAHKVGTTLPVSADIASSWEHMPAVEVALGGQRCWYAVNLHLSSQWRLKWKILCHTGTAYGLQEC